MRPFGRVSPSLFLIALFMVAVSSHAVVCKPAPVSPATDPLEDQLRADLKKVIDEADGCRAAGDSQCANRTNDLNILTYRISRTLNDQSACATNGMQEDGSPLPDPDRAYYASQAAFWNSLYQTMGRNDSAIAAGTYVIPSTVLNFAFRPVTPAIAQKPPTAPIKKPDVKPPVLLQPYTTAKGVKAGTINVVTDVPPKGFSTTLTPYSACDGKNNSLGKPADVIVLPLGEEQPTVTVPLTLDKPLKAGDSVCVVRKDTPNILPAAEAAAQTASTASATLYTIDKDKPKLCNDPYAYNDCHWVFSAIGGVEQTDLSSQNSQTDGFIDAFIRSPASSGIFVWTEIRVLGAPSNSNTQNISAAITNASGSVTASTLSTVGTSIDYVLGGEVDLARSNNGYLSLGLIAGFGATTPLSSQTATVAYAVPAYGSNECSQLQQKLSMNNGYRPSLPAAAHSLTQQHPERSSRLQLFPFRTHCRFAPCNTLLPSQGVLCRPTTFLSPLTALVTLPTERRSLRLPSPRKTAPAFWPKTLSASASLTDSVRTLPPAAK